MWCIGGSIGKRGNADSTDFRSADSASLHQRLIKCHRCAIVWCFACRVRRLHLRLIEGHRCAIFLPILQSHSDNTLLTAYEAIAQFADRQCNTASLQSRSDDPLLTGFFCHIGDFAFFFLIFVTKSHPMTSYFKKQIKKSPAQCSKKQKTSSLIITTNNHNHYEPGY